MKSYKDLVKYYKLFNNWDSFLEEVFEENTSLIPYSHREMNVFQIEIDNPPSIKSIVDRNNQYFEELKDRFSKKALTNSNIYSLIEKEIAEIQSYFIGNAYHLRYAPEKGKEDSFIYEFDLLEKDLREGKIKGGDFALFTVSEISAYCKYWRWLHSEEVSKFYFNFSTKVNIMSLHEIQKAICSDFGSTNENDIDENEPIKDSLMIEIIIAFGQTTREIITNLKQYKETLSDIEKEFFNTDVLDMANNFFLNNRTSIHYIENAHSKKSEESKKEIYYGIKSAFLKDISSHPLPTKQKNKIKIEPIIEPFYWENKKKHIEKLFSSLDNVYISNVDLEKFKTIFYAPQFNDETKSIETLSEPIKWKKSKVLLAYFINELIRNKHIKSSKHWKTSEFCFGVKNLKQSFAHNKYPKGYEEIDKIVESFTK